MDNMKLRISPRSLGDKMLLAQVVPFRKYIDGKPSDEVEGYRYVVALPAHNLDKISVKIPGKQQMDDPAGGFPAVTFTGLEVKPYVMNGQLQVTATATAIAEAK